MNTPHTVNDGNNFPSLIHNESPPRRFPGDGFGVFNSPSWHHTGNGFGDYAGSPSRSQVLVNTLTPVPSNGMVQHAGPPVQILGTMPFVKV